MYLSLKISRSNILEINDFKNHRIIQIYKLRVCLVVAFKNYFMFLKTKNTKTYLIEEVIFVFIVPHVLKIIFFKEKKMLLFIFLFLFFFTF